MNTITLNGKTYDVVPLVLDGAEGVTGELFGDDGETGQPWRMWFWLPLDGARRLSSVEPAAARGSGPQAPAAARRSRPQAPVADGEVMP